MTQRQYDAATARALMKLAHQEYEDEASVPYVKRDDGLHVNESFRVESPPGTAFDWTPADEMDWPGGPNPDTAPFLPIPFTASELAASMLDGPGQSIQFALDRRIGYPLDDGALGSIRARHRWMHDALEEAYALAAAAQFVVGEFDHDEEARAHTLAQQYDDANGQANDREGVFGKDITPKEANARRARAVASVADLQAQKVRAQATVADKWKTWRKAMVRELLQPQKAADSAIQAAPTGNTASAPVVADNASDAPACDFSMLATRKQLIEAFGRFTGMDMSWFKKLQDTPALLAARKVSGQGGRGHIAEPRFCPFEVMQWLADSKRRKGRALSTEKAWDLLEKSFSKVFHAHSVADPRAGD